MASIRTNSNPAMLAWARDEVGLSLEQAAKAIGISTDSLKNAESGERPLTLRQLRTAADMYGCPFGYFYLSKPPHKKSFKPVPDYRIAPGFSGVDHYRLNLEIKKARDRRLLYLDLITSLEMEAPAFQTLPQDNYSKSAASIRKRLNVSETEIYSLNYTGAYPYWKSKIENDGVLVYESLYIPEESGVIGAAIYYERCPIIIIKRGRNSNERKLFTLLHEYAHLLFGMSALTDAEAQTITQPKTGAAKVEARSNQLAAEILVPSHRIKRSDYSSLPPVEKMMLLSDRFKVTYTTAAVCLKRFGLINKSEFNKLLELRRIANEQKLSANDPKKPIPRENTQRLDLGRPFFNVVLTAYGSGIIDLFDASTILKLRVKKIDRLLTGTV